MRRTRRLEIPTEDPTFENSRQTEYKVSSMNSKKMASFTGYLVGKVQLDGAIQTEVLTSLVATLFQRYTTSFTDPATKTLKFNDNTKYFVECSERGLKITSPGVKPKDEGFESDCDSIRSVSMIHGSNSAHNGAANDSSYNELDLADLMNHLNVSGKQPLRPADNGLGGASGNSSNLASLSSASSGNSIDNTSISSSQNIQVLDDNNSSSGNGSDSDEFCTPPNLSVPTTNNNSSSDEQHHHRTSPYWEILPNLSSFQSYPLEDVVFCHCDIVHPNVLVWVVRHSAKMIALVTAFRTKAESEQLFQKYRELRVLVKAFKNASSIKLSSVGSNKLSIVPSPSPQSVPITLHPAQQPPIPVESELVPYSSLPAHVAPTEILHESKSKSPLFFGSRESKSTDFRFDEGGLPVGKNNNRLHNYYGSNSNTISSTYSKLTKLTAPWTSSISSASSSSTMRPSSKSLSASSPIIFPPNQPQQRFAQAGIRRFDGSSSLLSRIENNANASEGEEDDSDSDEVESQQESFKTPLRTLRKTGDASCSSIMQQVRQSKPTTSAKPVVLVPLKTETVSSPRPIYPKESYLYHVMGRTSSTFAPYQRSINFFSQYTAINGANNSNMSANEYLAWGNERHALVPFSSWVEIADVNKLPHNGCNANGTTSRKMCYAVPKTRLSSSRSSSSRTSTLAHLNPSKGTAKILLRDSAGHHHGMWATISQRFKRNIRESLMQKFNGVWPNQTGSETRGNFGAAGRGKKKGNKKVTFNAWATVQMV